MNRTRARVVLASLVLLSGGLAASMLSCGSAVSGVPFDPAAPTFPTTKGQNLNERTFDIPAGLDAPLNILLVAFYQNQQKDVDTWVQTAKDLSTDHANIEYYELPVLSSSWSVMRGWIDGGMRRGIPDLSARERTITIYTDTDAFRSLAGIDDPSRIWVGLVDRQGRVYWSARGPATAQSLESLRLTASTAARQDPSPAANPSTAPTD